MIDLKINKHELKHCGRCDRPFECKVGDIAHCQCNVIKFAEEERRYIATMFTDCLCIDCMISLRAEYNISQRESQLKLFFKGR